LLRFLVGDVQEVAEVAREVHFARRALDLRHTADRLLQALLQRRGIAARLRDQRRSEPILLREQRSEQVLRLDLLVVLPERKALRLGERFLQLGGEFVVSHGLTVVNAPTKRWGPSRAVQVPRPWPVSARIVRLRWLPNSQRR